MKKATLKWKELEISFPLMKMKEKYLVIEK
jgi:hypothetical protein